MSTWSAGPKSDLADAAEELRKDARARGVTEATGTLGTLDGEITLEYRAEDYLRITFTGDAPERSYLLAPDWPGTE
jgi:hypothetical protein